MQLCLDWSVLFINELSKQLSKLFPFMSSICALSWFTCCNENFIFRFFRGEKNIPNFFLSCFESVKNKSVHLFTSSPSPPAAKHQASISTRLALPHLPHSKNSWAPLSYHGEGEPWNICCWNFSHTPKHKMDSSPFSTGEQKKKKKKAYKQTQQRGPTKKSQKFKKKMMTNGSCAAA